MELTLIGNAMLTNKDYCDYETCVALREFGYNAPQRLIPDYFGVFEEPQYDERIHLYDAQKWLREEKKIDVMIQLDTKDIHLSSKYYSIYMSYMSRFRREFSYISQNFDSYEEALAEGVREAVKILKEK